MWHGELTRPLTRGRRRTLPGLMRLNNPTGYGTFLLTHPIWRYGLQERLLQRLVEPGKQILETLIDQY